jgi:hypothetical protein
MIKTFRSRAIAETDLFVHGFRPFRIGKWIKDGFIATIHPIPGSMAVRVGYAEVAR